MASSIDQVKTMPKIISERSAQRRDAEAVVSSTSVPGVASHEMVIQLAAGTLKKI